MVLQEDFMDFPCEQVLRNEISADCDPVAKAGERISAAVAAVFLVTVRDIHATTRRTASVALARQSAMYLAHVAFGLSFTDAGRAFGRVRTTAARACRVIEDRRENLQLDTALADLEHALRRDLGATRGAVS
jgi:chromosomal replication initiation ATPase DnaA